MTHPSTFKPILTTLVYCLQDGQVLLMHRNKQPNKGLWTAPGGKIDPGESPYECALRELHEESGLHAGVLTLRGVVTETSPREDWQWMLFLYLAEEITGELVGDEREGLFRWWPLADLYSVQMPEADVIFSPYVLDRSRPFFDARFHYDADLRRTDHPFRLNHHDGPAAPTR